MIQLHERNNLLLYIHARGTFSPPGFFYVLPLGREGFGFAGFEAGAFCKQSLHLGIVLGSKRVKVRKGTTALLAKPQFSLSYNLSLSWQALTFIAHSHFFS